MKATRGSPFDGSSIVSMSGHEVGLPGEAEDCMPDLFQVRKTQSYCPKPARWYTKGSRNIMFQESTHIEVTVSGVLAKTNNCTFKVTFEISLI